MRDPRDLYTVNEGAQRHSDVPVLVHALRGSLDAGHAGEMVARHLLSTMPSERVATFDADELVDYRSRRPALTFEDWRFTDYDEPVVALDLLRGPDGEQLLLLHGPEPDLQWDRFTTAVIELIEQLGVERTIGVHGIPMAVPHTRPISVTAHATRDELIDPQRHLMGRLQVPGNVAGLLELRLGKAGHDALGFAANVPHYLAQSEYPQAALALVRQIAGSTGLSLPLEELESAAAQTAGEIESQVAQSAEVGAVVRALEQQYDAFMESAAQPGQTTLVAEPALPSAEEIGAELEQFLAGLGEDGENGDSGAPGETGEPENRS